MADQCRDDSPSSPPVSPRFGDMASQQGPGVNEPSVITATKGREPLPFATDVSLQEAMDEMAAIESKLMEVSMERSKVRSFRVLGFLGPKVRPQGVASVRMK